MVHLSLGIGEPSKSCQPIGPIIQRIGTIYSPEILRELAPNVLLTEARFSQAYLDALAALVRQSHCYRLETGRDFEALPLLLRGLVE